MKHKNQNDTKLNHELYYNRLDKVWYTIKDSSIHTSLSESTIRRAIKNRKLRYLKVSGRIIINRNWIDNWLEGKNESC